VLQFILEVIDDSHFELIDKILIWLVDDDELDEIDENDEFL